MDQAAHRLAAKPFGQHVQFLDQCCQHCVRLEQIDGYEMIRSQDLSQLQVFLHAIAEEAARKSPAFAPHRHDATVPGTARSGEFPPGKPQPGGQVDVVGKTASRISG